MTSTQRPRVTAHARAASLHGGRALNQDAWDCRTYAHTSVTGFASGYRVAAVADGLGWHDGSGYVAYAAARMACALAAAEDFSDDLPHLIRTVAAALPEVGQYARSEDYDDDYAQALEGFGDRAPLGYNDAPFPDTTLVVATVDEYSGDVHVAWSGDSRAYVLTESGRLVQLTTDHNEAFTDGDLTKGSGALVRTLATAAVNRHGPQGNQWVAWSSEEFRPRRVLLCTDGVHGPLEDVEIAAILESTAGATEAAERLTSAAVAAAGAGADNATALVIDIKPAQ
ncbi:MULTISPECIES: PP2C family serine/threonine-protein phosphatase [unclassified Nocardia]|uniref:PP2C family protein-serine/threonine phosphatase n=1 Tax=unclassified Nocardia TaxID=2637762 RepID=UPI00278BD0CE|nr:MULTISPECIES: protein phosphatase 2C domain-containing protein [unclassified Nocardia]